MIISHRHRFVFVKTTKTAGTSIEIALSRHCGPEDVITPIFPDDEVVRQANGGPGPQNTRAVLPGGAALKFHNHAPARRARRLLGKRDWPNWFSFAFVRNPWDRMVSAYHFALPRRVDAGLWAADTRFDQFLFMEPEMQTLQRTGLGLFTEDDEIIVSQVYRFENLSEAMEDICGRLALPDLGALPRTKVSERRPYRDYYSANTQKRVAQLFERDIDIFGYAF